MKTIVTIWRDRQLDIRVYEVPEGAEIKAGDKVLVESAFGEEPGMATQDPIEVADDIVKYFTAGPLLKITAIVMPIAPNQQDDHKDDEN